MSDDVFTTKDTALYAALLPENGVVSLHIPGIGGIRMTLSKAEDLSADLARQAEYGRWEAKRINDLRKKVS